MLQSTGFKSEHDLVTEQKQSEWEENLWIWWHSTPMRGCKSANFWRLIKSKITLGGPGHNQVSLSQRVRVSRNTPAGLKGMQSAMQWAASGTASSCWGPQPYNHKELNSANNPTRLRPLSLRSELRPGWHLDCSFCETRAEDQLSCVRFLKRL